MIATLCLCVALQQNELEAFKPGRYERRGKIYSRCVIKGDLNILAHETLVENCIFSNGAGASVETLDFWKVLVKERRYE